MITQSELKMFFKYDPDTGIFTRRMHLGNNAKAGKEAGFICNTHGYKLIAINKRNYNCSRLAWLYTHGKWPDGQIDHINHDKTDNRICNLRDVSEKDNHKNRPLMKNNKSGHNGISFCERSKSYCAAITINKKIISKRFYTSKYENPLDEAIKWRKEKEKEFGYHENHGA